MPLDQTAVDVDIFTDIICPWCAVGDARFAKARALLPDVEVRPRWRAFQLNPTMPPEGMDRQDYISAKFGGPAQGAQVYDAVSAAGEDDGVAFDFPAIKRTPNTVQAHRLFYWAQDQVRPRPMMDALHEAYFRQGRDIGDDATLSDIAAEAGFDGAEAFLAGDDLRDAVLADDAEARRIGVSGVPLFIFGGRYALSGAQPPEALARGIEAALAAEDENA